MRFALLCAIALLSTSVQAAPLWSELNAAQVSALGAPRIRTVAARVLQLDLPALTEMLSAAPAEFSSATPLRFALPMPDGSTAEFDVRQTQVMHPNLAARHPQIRTYIGRSVSDRTVSARFDTTPQGFHAIVFAPSGTVYVDPYRQGDATHYLCYYKRDARRASDVPRAGDKVFTLPGAETAPPRRRAKADGPGELRTYRVAVAATGEYSEYHDPANPPGKLMPDKAVVLAAIVTMMNRITGIYERELAVRMEIIEREEEVIFTNRVADPYEGVAGLSDVYTNTIILNTLIGAETYDIGHRVSEGIGGVALLGSVCGNNKGGGITGLTPPDGDPFWVDFVAHEMGHQFGGNHTFNSEMGSCSGNGNASTAYEPGSGSTIMAYAGICGADDLQPHSDDYFHGVSYDEMTEFTRFGGGNNCAVITPTGNTRPVAIAGNSGLTIPRQTPFELTGKGSGADGNTLTYQWEQFDLGPAGPVSAPVGSAPRLRSYNPTPEPTRVFPRLPDLLNNTTTIGELLPTQAGPLNFRFNVRDHHPAGGEVSFDFAALDVADAGPFVVTQPNDEASYAPGSMLEVTWNVAGTDAPPVSCAAVDILLSGDGGLSYAPPLAAKTPNDGAHSVKLPMTPVASARLKVKCSNNVFFDISDRNFSIGSGKSGKSGGGLLLGAFSPWMLLMLLVLRRARVISQRVPVRRYSRCRGAGARRRPRASR